MCKKIAFITAGGLGDRMDTHTPKQFLLIKGTPVIIHTLKKFEKNTAIDAIIVVCLHGWEDYLTKLASEYGISKLIAVVTGGDNSQESVINGMSYLVKNNFDNNDIVIVHESVRPFVSERIINDNIETCINCNNAVTAIRGNESYLYSEDGCSSDKTLLREMMYMVQTPQTFRLGDLIETLNEAKKQGRVFQSLFLMMSELKDTPLNLVKGDRFNIKLTYPEDLKISEMLVSMDLAKL